MTHTGREKVESFKHGNFSKSQSYSWTLGVNLFHTQNCSHSTITLNTATISTCNSSSSKSGATAAPHHSGKEKLTDRLEGKWTLHRKGQHYEEEVMKLWNKAIRSDSRIHPVSCRSVSHSLHLENTFSHFYFGKFPMAISSLLLSLQFQRK